MDIQHGHVAVITGAGGGIGTALAKVLAAKGCHLALADISSEAMQKTAESLANTDIIVTQHIVDVTNKTAMAQLAKDVLRAHGGVNLLINNAGITLQKNFSTHSLEDWERVICINLWGVIYGCHYFDLALSQAQDAHVVNMSSMASFVGFPAQSSYCTTKAAVQMLSHCLWAEWSLKNIGVTSVHPGAIRTNMIKATLEESDDIEQARKNYEMAYKNGTDAGVTAAKIIRAVEKNKQHLKIGYDAHILHFISKFMPRFSRFAMKKIAQKLAT